MHGYQAPALSFFLLGGWILSGYWPADYDGKYRFLTGLVDDMIAAFGAVPLGLGLIGLAVAITLVGRTLARLQDDEAEEYH